MTKAILAAALAAACAVSGQAGEFPLALKKLTSREALESRGGYGCSGQIEYPRPKELKKEPQASSDYALYGRFFGDGGQMVFRVDESKGTGKGYDRLIVDLNRNNDLSDDLVIERDEKAPNENNSSYERVYFGPLELASVSIGPYHPTISIEVGIYSKERIGKAGKDETLYLGNARLMAAWLLEAKVELEGSVETIAIRDGNCNFKLGEGAQASKIYRQPGDQGSWYLFGRDYVIRAAEKAGGQNDAKAEMLSSVIYFDAKPCTVRLGDDLKTLRVEPYAGKTGVLTLKNRLGHLVLARETGADEWEAVTPRPKDGKSVVPAGNYRVVSCGLSAKAGDGSGYGVGSNQGGEQITKVEAGKTAALDCGWPLDIRVSAKKTNAGAGGGLVAWTRNLFGSSASDDLVLVMDAKVFGSGGEQYTSFSKTLPNQPQSYARLDPPSFRVFDPAGQQVAAGSFQFG